MTRALRAACLSFLLWWGMAATAPPLTADPLFEVPVILATDANFRGLPSWRGLARDALARATEDWPAMAGIRFRVVGEREWEPRDAMLDLAPSLDDALGQVPSDSALVVFFRGDRGASFPAFTDQGYAYLNRPAIMVAAPRSSGALFGARLANRLGLFVRHELGHVFGLPHSARADIMNPQPSARTPHFEQLQQDVLRAHAGVNLFAPVPYTGADLSTLRDAYLLMARMGDMETALLVNLGAAFHHHRRPAEARELFAAALEREGNAPEARVGLAQTTLAAGDSAATRGLLESMPPPERLTPALAARVGGLWVRLTGYTTAGPYLNHALSGEHPGFTPWFYRGLARYHQGDYRGAASDYERALAQEARPEGWFNLGLAYDALHDSPNAVRAFTAYLEHAAGEPGAAAAKAFLERHRKRLRERGGSDGN